MWVCWVLFCDVGWCYCCSLFSKFRMLYHYIFVLKFLFVDRRIFDKMSHPRDASPNNDSGDLVFVKGNFNLLQLY